MTKNVVEISRKSKSITNIRPSKPQRLNGSGKGGRGGGIGHDFWQSMQPHGVDRSPS